MRAYLLTPFKAHGLLFIIVGPDCCAPSWDPLLLLLFPWCLPPPSFPYQTIGCYNRAALVRLDDGCILCYYQLCLMLPAWPSPSWYFCSWYHVCYLCTGNGKNKLGRVISRMPYNAKDAAYCKYQYERRCLNTFIKINRGGYNWYSYLVDVAANAEKNPIPCFGHRSYYYSWPRTWLQSQALSTTIYM